MKSHPSKQVLHEELHSQAALNIFNISSTDFYRQQRDEEGLIFGVTLQSTQIWPIKKMIQIVRYSPQLHSKPCFFNTKIGQFITTALLPNFDSTKEKTASEH